MAVLRFCDKTIYQEISLFLDYNDDTKLFINQTSSGIDEHFWPKLAETETETSVGL